MFKFYFQELGEQDEGCEVACDDDAFVNDTEHEEVSAVTSHLHTWNKTSKPIQRRHHLNYPEFRISSGRQG